MSESVHARLMEDPQLPRGFNARLSQAQGMVAVQAKCSVDEAMLMISDRATVEGVTMDEIATGVLERTIRFGE